MTDRDTLIDEAIALLKRSEHAVALTGAGISTPSGIPDFRSAGSGLWEAVDPMEVASIYAFRRRPESFYDWVGPHAELILKAKPNAAHSALVTLEKHGPLKCVITQNIDTLHSKAGSECVYEVHGHMREATCLQCYEVFDAKPFLVSFIESTEVPRCPRCSGVLKPNVILFGELLPVGILAAARENVRMCDLLLVAGSSLETAPAGDLPLVAKQAGATVIIVNIGVTALDHLADVRITDDVVDILPRLAAPFAPG